MNIRDVDIALRRSDVRRGTPSAKALGARMRHSRRRVGLTGRQLADVLMVTPNFLYHVESGAIPPSAMTLVRYSLVVGTTPESLLDLDESSVSEKLPSWTEITRQMAALHGVDVLSSNPEDWPPGPKDHLMTLLVFGISPTRVALAETLSRHPELPPEFEPFEVAERFRSSRFRRLAEWYMAASPDMLNVFDTWLEEKVRGSSPGMVRGAKRQ